MLPPRHAEIEVVEDEDGQADVPTRGVDQVRASDTGAAVSHDDDDREVRARQLDPRRVGDAAAVEAVEGTRREVLVGEPRAADVGDQDDSLRVELQRHERRVEVIEDRVVAAPRAERIRGLVAIG